MVSKPAGGGALPPSAPPPHTDNLPSDQQLPSQPLHGQNGSETCDQDLKSRPSPDDPLLSSIISSTHPHVASSSLTSQQIAKKDIDSCRMFLISLKGYFIICFTKCGERLKVISCYMTNLCHLYFAFFECAFIIQLPNSYFTQIF